MDDLLFKGQGSTILDLVNQIFLKGEFTCPVTDELKEGEIVIGELSDYEKAIIIASGQVIKRHNDAVDKEETGEECDSVQKYLDKAASQVYESLLWASIHNRLGKVAVENDRIGLRKDWKIAAAPEEEGDDKDCASCPMAFLCPEAR
jgi:hypothetical protein